MDIFISTSNIKHLVMEKTEIEEGVIVLTQENYQQLLGKQVKILTTELEKVTTEAKAEAKPSASAVKRGKVPPPPNHVQSTANKTAGNPQQQKRYVD